MAQLLQCPSIKICVHLKPLTVLSVKVPMMLFCICRVTVTFDGVLFKAWGHFSVFLLVKGGG